MTMAMSIVGSTDMDIAATLPMFTFESYIYNAISDGALRHIRGERR
jgi:L-cysteine desulfidase